MENKQKQGGMAEMLKKLFAFKAMWIGVIAIVVLAAGAIGLRSVIASDPKATKLGFEDIGELATQAAYCTEVNVTEASRELFGVQIPFTQSKYIYSYDVIIKAGFDFTAVEWQENDETITVKMPPAEVLSSEIVDGSFKVYHEQESIFRPISLTENNEAVQNMKQQAQQTAIANGLLENARDNGRQILLGFFENAYDMDEYTVKFVE